MVQGDQMSIEPKGISDIEDIKFRHIAEMFGEPAVGKVQNQEDINFQKDMEYINNIDIEKAKFLTKEEAATFLRCSERSIDRARERGLPSYSLGREIVFIKEQLVKWVMKFGKI